jgi:regulatory protein
VQPQAKKNTPEKKKPPKKITADYLHNSGLYYLQRFAASSGHFRSVMLRKVKKSCHYHKEQDYAACTALVDELVRKFERAGLLDDQAYTRGVVTSLRRQGKSRRAVVARLQAKNINADTALEVLHAYDENQFNSSADAEMQAALIFTRRKKLGAFRKDKDYSEEKALAAMGRAGFSYDTARRALALSLEEAEERIRL